MICKSNLERVHFLLDIHLSTSTQAGADSGGAWGGPCPPSFGTEPAQNAEVYRAISPHSYFDAAYIPLLHVLHT